MRYVLSRNEQEDSARRADPKSGRQSRPLRQPVAPRSPVEAPRYRFVWQRGPRSARHERTWGQLRRGPSVAREDAARDWSVTVDPFGVATLLVEANGERMHLWHNWHASNYPFVCALLEELGKPLPFGPALPLPPARSRPGNDSTRSGRVSRRDRSRR